MPTFEVRVPVGANQIWLRQQIREAVAEATRRGKLRPNSVDSITGENSGDNLGPGTPIMHFEQWEKRDIEVRLILKGGGCENTNAQYSLPAELDHLGRADRTLEGVRKCILHAVWKAQGKGCSPARSASASAAIARRATCTRRSSCSGRSTTRIPIRGWRRSKRSHGRSQPAHRRADGIQRQDPLIGCKIGALNRLPASFFVSIAYDCWAFRRLGVNLDAGTGAITSWMYRDESPSQPMLSPEARRRRLPAHRARDPPARADLRRGRPRAEGRRRGARLRPRVHRARRGARAPDEARAAGRSSRRGPLSLRSGRGEGRRRLARHRRRADHEHP